jgi:hypothetical protein
MRSQILFWIRSQWEDSQNNEVGTLYYSGLDAATLSIRSCLNSLARFEVLVYKNDITFAGYLLSITIPLYEGWSTSSGERVVNFVTTENGDKRGLENFVVVTR